MRMSLDPLPLYLTLWISLVSTVSVVVLGTPLSWLLARKKFWGRNLIDAVLMQPLVIPPTVLGYYLLVLFGRRRPIGEFLEQQLGIQIAFTWRGAVIAAAVA